MSNAGPLSVAAVRVVVTGLTNQLFNAVGTNNGNPFVVYGSALDTNQSVNLLLQFYPRSLFSVYQWTVARVRGVRSQSGSAAGDGGKHERQHLAHRATAPMAACCLICHPLTSRTYTVVYSDNVLFSNAMIAPPSIVAPANQTPWIDYGPPTTVSQPTNSPARFYRDITSTHEITSRHRHLFHEKLHVFTVGRAVPVMLVRGCWR